MRRKTMDEPLRAYTFNEVRYYLLSTPCPACEKGPWRIDSAPVDHPAGQAESISAHCRHCDHREQFLVVCEHAGADPGPDEEIINPTDRPSRIVDLAQWLSLFYMLIERASRKHRPTEARLDGYRAALCLAEALKFYGPEDELPPASAFFTSAGQRAFHEHAEKFARQKLRDMQAKLPALRTMARRLGKDKTPRRKKWWRFWKSR